jgi:hypothetical protein
MLRPLADLDPAPRNARRPRWRALGHVLAFAIGWPAFTVWFAPRQLTVSTLFNGIPPAIVRLGMAWSTVVMWRELAAGVAALSALSLGAALLSGGLRPTGAGRVRQLAAGGLEAVVTGLALLCGIAAELPAALRHPALAPLWSWPVSRVLLALAVLTAAAALALAGRSLVLLARRLAVAALLAGIGLGAARGLPDGGRERAGRGARIVLGLDSISADGAIEPLRALTAANGGTWYEQATSPGLLTNSVWTAIVTSRMPSETGVFFTFQTPDWTRLPPSLPVRAKTAGLHTCSFFSDQLTMQLGADLPFDENHSGPRGWLQVGTAAVKDTSWFLPLVLAHLPPLPGAATQANQGGTYSFSLERELADVLTCNAGGGETLVLAHLDYLHQARYPGMSELTGAERARVRATPVEALVDESIHWQYPVRTGEPLGVYRWKLEHLQQALGEAIARTGVLAGRGNALVVFSDHGPRTGLTPQNFGEARYWHVPLATFGLRAGDPAQPISVVDLARLVALPEAGRPDPAPPVVEYTAVTAAEWAELAYGTELLLDGRAALSGRILGQVGARLSRFDPHAPAPRYVAVPSAPVVEAPIDPRARIPFAKQVSRAAP